MFPYVHFLQTLKTEVERERTTNLNEEIRKAMTKFIYSAQYIFGTQSLWAHSHFDMVFLGLSAS